MFKLTNVLIISFTFILANIVMGNDTGAKKILEKAYLFMTETNYQATIIKQVYINEQKRELSYIISHHYDEKAGSVFRIQCADKNAPSYEIKNKKGFFVILFRKDGAYKILTSGESPNGISTLRGDLNFLPSLKDEFNYKDITFSSKKVNNNGIECYEILRKEKSMPSPQVLAERNLWNYDSKLVGKIKVQSEEHYPFIKKYIIGVEKPFIYSCEYFNVNGKMGRTYYWNSPDFRVKFDSNYFQLPAGEIIQVNEYNLKEEIKKLNAWKKQQ